MMKFFLSFITLLFLLSSSFLSADQIRGNAVLKKHEEWSHVDMNRSDFKNNNNVKKKEFESRQQRIQRHFR